MAYIKYFVSGIGGLLAYYLGGFDLLLKTVLMLTILDFCTGVLGGIYQKNLSSEYGYKGIIKKVYMYFTICLATVIQHLIGNTIPIREMVILFYIVNESLSILENVGKVITYPEKLKQIILQLKESE